MNNPNLDKKGIKKLYAWNWIGGGFNDVFATSKKEALKLAHAGGTLKVDMKTFRRVKKADWNKYFDAIPFFD